MKQTRQKPAAQERRLDEMLVHGRACVWTGPDRNHRVDRFLKENSMLQHSSQIRIGRTGVILLATGLIGGAAVGSIVTARVLSGQATLTLDDGREIRVIVNDSGQGTLGRMVTDDGREISFDPADPATQQPAPDAEGSSRDPIDQAGD